MTLLQSILLGMLQGATEFIPVSSSAHLVLVPFFLGWPEPGLSFDAVLHLGTLVSVLVCFWPDLVLLIRAWIRSVRRRRIEADEERLAWLLIVSAIPAGFAGFALGDIFEGLFGSPTAVAALLMVTGMMLFLAEQRIHSGHDLSSLRLAPALGIGVAQAVAIAPGISRSGATISAGLAVGLSREAATRFSFLMSIPVIAGAGASQVYAAAQSAAPVQSLALVAGFIAATATGLAAIRFLVKFVHGHSLRVFAYYCWAVGAAALVATLVI